MTRLTNPAASNGYSARGRREFAVDPPRSPLNSSQPVSEDEGELGAALTRLVAALERVSLHGLQPGDRDLVEQVLLAARAALDRATSRKEPFPEED